MYLRWFFSQYYERWLHNNTVFCGSPAKSDQSLLTTVVVNLCNIYICSDPSIDYIDDCVYHTFA